MPVLTVAEVLQSQLLQEPESHPFSPSEVIYVCIAATQFQYLQSGQSADGGTPLSDLLVESDS